VVCVIISLLSLSDSDEKNYGLIECPFLVFPGGRCFHFQNFNVVFSPRLVSVVYVIISLLSLSDGEKMYGCGLMSYKFLLSENVCLHFWPATNKCHYRKILIICIEPIKPQHCSNRARRFKSLQ
jgi:hypothetical protein